MPRLKILTDASNAGRCGALCRDTDPSPCRQSTVHDRAPYPYRGCLSVRDPAPCTRGRDCGI